MALSKEEKQKFAEVLDDPVRWTETFLKNPDDPQKNLELRSYQKEVLAATKNEQQMVLRYGRRMGKCSNENNYVMLTTGERIQVKELWKRYQAGEELQLMNVTTDLNIVNSKSIIMEDNGQKETFEVLTKSGRKIEVTENHPLLRIDGWQPVADLNIGDQILVPSKLDTYNSTYLIQDGVNPNEDEHDISPYLDHSYPSLIAYLLSDGSIINRVSFTNQNENIISDFKESCKTFDVIPKITNVYRNNCHELTVTFPEQKNNPIIDNLRTWNLYGKNSYNKFIPANIFKLDKLHQAIFLSKLFACDGWASVSKSNRNSGNCEIGYCSVSEELIYGISHILVRFGIKHFVTEKNIKYKDGIKKAYQILIRNKEDIISFANQIGIFGKEEAVKNVVESVSKRSDIKNGYFYQIPKEVIDIYNIKTPRKYGIRKKYNPSKDKVLAAAKDQGITDLINLCESDTYFDEIVSIRSTGINQTYAIEVPGTHNYVDSDIITHNTVVLCADALWWTTAQPLATMYKENGTKQIPFDVLIMTPMDSQIKMIFDTLMSLCGDSPYLKDQIESVKRSDVNEIHFKNGSVIKGMTLGISSANKGTSVRGQCLTGDTLISMADGSHKYISDVIEGELVWSIDDNNNIIKSSITKVFEPNIKTVYEIKLQSGKKIKCSEDHKLYGCNNKYDLNWKPLKEFKVGEYLSSQKNSNVLQHQQRDINNDDIKYHQWKQDIEIYKLIGYLIGDGSCGIKSINNGSVGFTNNNITILNEYKEILTKLNISYSIDSSKSNGLEQVRVFGLKKKNIHFSNILKKYEIYGKLAYDKSISNLIKSDDPILKSIFINRLYSTDGWICESKNNQYEIGYCTVSEQLAFDILSILNSFGIHAKIQERDKQLNGKFCAKQYVIKIRSKFMIKRFLENIGLIFGKEDQSKIVYNVVKNETIDNYKYKNHMINDIHLDKIISITKLSEEETFDIEVKGPANFFANGIVVHNSADLLMLDEADYIPRDIMEQSVLPIASTKLTTRIRACSTPSGKREIFFDWCTKGAEIGWWARHYPSWHPDNPSWLSIADAEARGLPITDSTEFKYRSYTSEEAYIREYGAEFGEELQGVYKHKHINASLVNYFNEYNNPDVAIFDPGFEQKPGNKYVIGVDWNTYKNGGQVVMIEYCHEPTFIEYYDHVKQEEIKIDCTGKIRLFYRKGIKSMDATQRETRNEIIRLMTYYKVDFLYVDYGAGDTNVEELTLYGKNNPQLGMARKLHVIDSGASTEHYDPLLQKMVKKRNKGLMINQSVLALEEGRLILPKEEDTNHRLVDQIRGYTVKTITARGDFTYEGEDHVLDAFNLAVYGFYFQYGNLLKTSYEHRIKMMMNPLLDEFHSERQIEPPKQGILSNKQNIRDPEKGPSFNRPKMLRGPVNTRSGGGVFGNGFRKQL